MQEVAVTRRTPRGSLRICSSFGFGRRVLAPMVSELVGVYPELQVRFEVFDRLLDVAAEGFDLDVRVGDEVAPHLIARKLRVCVEFLQQRFGQASPLLVQAWRRAVTFDPRTSGRTRPWTCKAATRSTPRPSRCGRR